MRLNQREILALRETFLFYSMSEESYAAMTEQEQPFAREMLAAGERLELPREPERVIAVIVSGTLGVRYSGKLPVRKLRPGFVLGAVELFSNTSGSMPQILAEEDTALLIISASQLRHVFEEHSEIMMSYINFLTGQIHDLKLEHMLAVTASAEERLLSFLGLHMRGMPPTVSLPYSFVVLAERLHMSRASLYRAFSILEEQGILRREARNIIVLKPEVIPFDGLP